MSTINKKEFGWKKAPIDGNLAAGIFCGFFVLVPLAVSLIYNENISYTGPFIMLLISVFAFIDFFWMRKLKRKTSYIQITNDGIHVSPTSFILRAKDIKWKNISKIEKIIRNKRSVPYEVTLSLLTAKNIKIKLGILNIDDRNSLIQIIKETIENKTTA